MPKRSAPASIAPSTAPPTSGGNGNKSSTQPSADTTSIWHAPETAARLRETIQKTCVLAFIQRQKQRLGWVLLLPREMKGTAVSVHIADLVNDAADAGVLLPGNAARAQAYRVPNNRRHPNDRRSRRSTKKALDRKPPPCRHFADRRSGLPEIASSVQGCRRLSRRRRRQSRRADGSGSIRAPGTAANSGRNCKWQSGPRPARSPPILHEFSQHAFGNPTNVVNGSLIQHGPRKKGASSRVLSSTRPSMS